ncbi:hypothetical protein PVK06_027346 [Gossypium arboreum]|uniref:Uncharacterized protein n=1 Tax=Gossypium arboreum TaxID=29729 RepID=A0ABR0P008_GOSAR|nr:hypothetical protein PVK06_027346 [Gossypium arboreum]
MRMVNNLDSYLGLPLPNSKKKSIAFTNIMSRCSCRINGWSKSLLLYSGKEIFIKAILQSIRTYAFSVFLAPKGVLEELQLKMRRMWWMSNEKNCGWAMMAWDGMCHPKGMGVLVSGTCTFSAWPLRQMHFKDTLCFKVLSAK